MKNIKKIIIVFLLIMPLTAYLKSEEKKSSLNAAGLIKNPKVDISWNRYYDSSQIKDIMIRLEKAFPSLAKVYSIGKSTEGRDIMCIEITNFKKGNPDRKPGMYIDGNIHGNEIQGSEVALYTAWYLLENYGNNKKITELVDGRVFYIIPTINPDGRDWFIHYPNTPNSSRSGKKPVDDDLDGLIDEDGYEDLDGDGNICQIRIKDPNGRWKPSSEDPRVMVRCKPDEKGTYTLLGLEGIDNDGDGRINEDGPGGYDLNRNWPFNWQPEYIQRGAHEYPFSLPETRAVGEFVLKHENIAAFQSYHNSGGMILQGPGQKDTPYAFQDAGIFEYIGKKGEEIIPGYRFVTVYKDMYTVWGGELDWFYLGRGILGFSNELFTSDNYFRKKTPPYQERRTRMFEPDKEPYDFNDLLLFGDAFVDWKPFKHPQFGEVEIGGFKKNFTRMPPSFLLEEECHRNAAFTLFYADCMPQVKIQNVEVKKIDGDLYNIWVTVENQKMIPTRTAQDVQNKISRPDQVKIYGENIKVLSAGFVVDKYTGVVTPVEKHPEYVEIPTLGGISTRIVQFTIKGKGSIKITIDSVKGGIGQTEIKI